MTEQAAPPVAIIETGVPPAPVAGRHGSFSHMICRAAGLRPDEAEIIAVYRGEALRPPSSYRAAIITGSPAMVTERAPWSERAAAWVRQAVDEKLPIYGICYGHQLLAHALGGRVDYHPRGREVGTRDIELLEPACNAPLTAGLPSHFPAQLIHQQTVVELPPGATVLARSDHDAHQIVQYGDGVLSTQFHPEFCTEIMATYLAHYADRLKEEGFDLDTLKAHMRPTPEAQALLLRFIERYVRTRTAA